MEQNQQLTTNVVMPELPDFSLINNLHAEIPTDVLCMYK